MKIFYLWNVRLVPRVQQLVILLCKAVYLLDLIFPCVGLCFHGASNMAGKTNGAAAVTQHQDPSVTYIHYVAHRQPLCCKIK